MNELRPPEATIIDKIARAYSLIFASIVTLNVRPWFSKEGRFAANEANGIVILTVVPLILLICLLLTIYTKTVFRNNWAKPAIMLLSIALFVTNYTLLHGRLGKDGVINYSHFGYRKRFLIRLFTILALFGSVGLLLLLV